MTQALSGDDITLVKASVPALREHGLAITTRMYERLFVNLEVKAMFDQAAQASGEQPQRLAEAILGFAQNVDRLHLLAAPIKRMAARHVETGVKPEHYPLVGQALLPAIRDILGSDIASDELLAAWGRAYAILSDSLIDTEEQLYKEQSATI